MKIEEMLERLRGVLGELDQPYDVVVEEAITCIEVMDRALKRQDQSIRLLVNAVHESWKLMQVGDESKECHDKVYAILSEGMIRFQDLLGEIETANARAALGIPVTKEQSVDERVKEAEEKLRDEMRENAKLMLENQSLKREMESRAIVAGD